MAWEHDPSAKSRERENDKWHSFNTTNIGKATNSAVTELVINAINTIIGIVFLSCSLLSTHTPSSLINRRIVKILLFPFDSASSPPKQPPRASTWNVISVYFFGSFFLFPSPTPARKLSLFALCVCMFGDKRKANKIITNWNATKLQDNRLRTAIIVVVIVFPRSFWTLLALICSISSYFPITFSTFLLPGNWIKWNWHTLNDCIARERVSENFRALFVCLLPLNLVQLDFCRW